MRFLHNNTFLKFVSSFVVLVCLTISVFGVFAYLSAKRIVTQNYFEQQQEILKHLSAGIQDKISVINEVSLLVSTDSRVSKAYFYEEDSSVENIQSYREIVNFLKGLSSSIDNVLNISVQYSEADVVVSHEGKYSVDMFYNQIVSYEGMESNDWRQLLSAYKNFSLIHFGKVNIGGQRERTLTFGRTLPYDNPARSYAFMTITVSEDFFDRMISPDMVKQNGSITIFKDDKLLLTTAKYMSDDMYKKLVDYDKGNEISIDGKEYLVSELTDGFNDWQYIVTIPMDEVTQSIDNFKLTMLVLVLIVLILGGGLSWFFSKRLYMPISKILHNVNGFNAGVSTNEADDFEMIRLGINSILVEKDGLMNELEIANSLLRTKVLSDIVNGRKEIFEIKDNWAKLGITFPFDCFQAIAMREKNYQVEIDVAISDIMKRYNNDFKIYIVIKDGFYVLLCNYKTADKLDTRVYEIANILADVAVGEVISVGKIYYRVEDIVHSCVEALFTLKHSGESVGVVSAMNGSRTEQIRKNYSIEEEQKLIWAVKTGDIKLVDSILNDMMESNNIVVYGALLMTAYKISVSHSLLEREEDYNILLLLSNDSEIISKKIIENYHMLVEHFANGAKERYNSIFLN